MGQSHYVPFSTTRIVRVCVTNLSDRRVMGLFRALRAKYNGEVEVSERSLALTFYLVHLNPANYTIWQYRAQVLIQMATDEDHALLLKKELEFLDHFALINMKNYQVWYVCTG